MGQNASMLAPSNTPQPHDTKLRDAMSDHYREEVARRLESESARLRRLGDRTELRDAGLSNDYDRMLLVLADSETAQADIDRLGEKHLRLLLKAAIEYVNRAEDLLYTRRTTRIALWPTPHTVMMHREAFDLVQEDLTALGHDAVVEPFEEWRGAGIDPDTLAWFPVYVWIAEEAGRIGRRVIDQLVGEVTTAVVKRFRDRSVDRVIIYGPRNEILAEVDLEAKRRSI